MITVGMNYDVCKGKEKDFEGYFGKVVELLTTMKGHKFSKLFHEVERPRSYMIVSEWDTMADFEVFTGSDAFRGAAEWAKDGILEGRPRHSIWQDQAK